MLDAILNPRISKATSNSDALSHDGPLDTPTENENFCRHQESEQLSEIKQQLEHSWVIEAVDFLKQGLKRPEKT